MLYKHKEQSCFQMFPDVVTCPKADFSINLIFTLIGCSCLSVLRSKSDKFVYNVILMQ